MIDPDILRAQIAATIYAGYMANPDHDVMAAESDALIALAVEDADAILARIKSDREAEWARGLKSLPTIGTSGDLLA